MSNSEDQSQDDESFKHNELFLSIENKEDAVVSRNRGAIAIFFLCIFALIGALKALVFGLNIGIDHDPNMALARDSLFMDAGASIFFVVIYVALLALITVKNSTLAAITLFALAALESFQYAQGFLAAGFSTPTAPVGMILGFVIRFFVLVTAINCWQGVAALRKFAGEIDGPNPGNG